MDDVLIYDCITRLYVKAVIAYDFVLGYSVCRAYIFGLNYKVAKSNNPFIRYCFSLFSVRNLYFSVTMWYILFIYLLFIYLLLVLYIALTC